MENLSEQSLEIIARNKVHVDRCLELQQRLGKVTARAFHVRWKADPANPNAEKEFALLLSGN